jgi:phospho-N-acetylmuramoyl-pentapeptide-transferase
VRRLLPCHSLFTKGKKGPAGEVIIPTDEGHVILMPYPDTVAFEPTDEELKQEKRERKEHEKKMKEEKKKKKKNLSEYGLPLPGSKRVDPIVSLNTPPQNKESAQAWIAAWRATLPTSTQSIDDSPVIAPAADKKVTPTQVGLVEKLESTGGSTSTSVSPNGPFRAPGSLPLMALVAASALATRMMDSGAVVVALADPLLGSMTKVLAACMLAASFAVSTCISLLVRAGLVSNPRPDGPPHESKTGMPTGAGLLFLPVAVLAAVVTAPLTPRLAVVIGAGVALAAIGLIDDLKSSLASTSDPSTSGRGMSAVTKFGLVAAVAVGTCVAAVRTVPGAAAFAVTPGGVPAYWAIAAAGIAATAHGVNLTDGLDGLAAGCSAIAALALAGCVGVASPDLVPFLVGLAGSCLGFAIHNRNPASVFMGNTGSLALGGMLATAAVLSQSLLPLVLAGGVFAINCVAVTAQVIYYKVSGGKRLFRMAPLHHHFELGGTHESTVTTGFWVASLMCGAAAVFVAGGVVA